jgi:hypothetical protein
VDDVLSPAAQVHHLIEGFECSHTLEALAEIANEMGELLRGVDDPDLKELARAAYTKHKIRIEAVRAAWKAAPIEAEASDEVVARWDDASRSEDSIPEPRG